MGKNRGARQWTPVLIGGAVGMGLAGLALILTRASGSSLLLTGGSPHPAEQMAAVTGAPARPPAALSFPLTTAHASRVKPSAPVSAKTAEPLAPSILMGTAGAAPSSGGSVVAAPARVEAPVAPPLVSAPQPSPPPAGASFVASSQPDAPASGPSMLSNGWTERPSQQENPEVVITNEGGGSATLILRGTGNTYRWLIKGDGVRETVLPGTYEYELREEIYRHTGRPDQFGTITLGKYRSYEGYYFHHGGAETRVRQLGD